MELKGMDLIKAYRKHPDPFLPKVNMRQRKLRHDLFRKAFREI